jgi:hypothetical protein
MRRQEKIQSDSKEDKELRIAARGILLDVLMGEGPAPSFTFWIHYRRSDPDHGGRRREVLGVLGWFAPDTVRYLYPGNVLVPVRTYVRRVRNSVKEGLIHVSHPPVTDERNRTSAAKGREHQEQFHQRSDIIDKSNPSKPRMCYRTRYCTVGYVR